MSQDPEKQTARIQQLERGNRITLELGEPEAAAEFLEHVAKLIREHKRITFWVE